MTFDEWVKAKIDADKDGNSITYADYENANKVMLESKTEQEQRRPMIMLSIMKLLYTWECAATPTSEHFNVEDMIGAIIALRKLDYFHENSEPVTSILIEYGEILLTMLAEVKNLPARAPADSWSMDDLKGES